MKTMNDNLTFAELRAANERRSETSFPECAAWRPMEWACAMAGEAGEACNKIKHLRMDIARGQIGPVGQVTAKERIAEELADLVTYADHTARSLGIDLGVAVRRKFNEVSERVKSPVRL